MGRVRLRGLLPRLLPGDLRGDLGGVPIAGWDKKSPPAGEGEMGAPGLPGLPLSEATADHALPGGAVEVLLGAGECGECFQAAGVERAPWNEGVGLEFQSSQGTAADAGSKDFPQEFDFLENRAFAKISRGRFADEE